ncbi:MAG: HlyD family efflux transporter periplasmic adaptor subunit [Methylacidiphilales bacterium]|nr:HlyD family efflux transporter periplasmic adaptor subunit [Candidatus Methylacidiphilales bacterium]
MNSMLEKFHSMTKARRALWIAGAVVAAILVYLACVYWPWKSLKFQGFVEGEYVYVASPVAGRLEELGVERGDSAKPGRMLFRLEADPEQQQRAQAEAQLVLANQNWERARQLIASHSISQKEYDQAESDQKASSENLAQIQWRLDQKTQGAKEAGYIQDTYYVKGEWVPEGHAVVSLLPPRNIRVRFFVDAGTLPQIQAGRMVRIRAFGLHQDWPGRVNYVSSQAEYTPPVIYSNETRAKLTFMIEVKPDAAALDHLHPGQPAEITLK